jgi:glycosyltransferase involved in cell wall biosynthesis
VARFLAHTKNPPNVIHGWPLAARKTLLVAKRLGLVSVVERPNTHTGYAYEVVEKEFKKLRMRVPTSTTHAFNAKRLAQEEAEYDLADYLACPSEFVLQSFRDRGVANSKLVAHQYGCDPNVCFPDVRIGETPPKLRVAFVGMCEPRKGLHYALDAWIASPAAMRGEFYICGKFIPGYREYLGARLQHPSVRLLGFVSDVPTLLRKCDVLILPSIEEGSALVTYEARACGCVLLVSDAAGARCTHLQDGLVHPAGNVGILQSHITLLNDDAILLPRLRASSIAGIAELSWGRAAQRLVDVYQQAIGEAKGKG